MLIGHNKPLSGALNHIQNWQEFCLKRASIRYIVKYTKIISKDRGNAKKLLPRVLGVQETNWVQWQRSSVDPLHRFRLDRGNRDRE